MPSRKRWPMRLMAPGNSTAVAPGLFLSPSLGGPRLARKRSTVTHRLGRRRTGVLSGALCVQPSATSLPKGYRKLRLPICALGTSWSGSSSARILHARLSNITDSPVMTSRSYGMPSTAPITAPLGESLTCPSLIPSRDDRSGSGRLSRR